ncbi:MAG: protein kinase, partial [Polyangiales bacterium]
MTAPSDRLRELGAYATFDKRFELVREAGAGGMGQVFEAIDRDSGRRLAVKVLATRGFTETARFTAEAEILEGLTHPRIVAYVAHGVTGGGEPYLAMEWLEGETLAQRLTGAPLSISEVIAIAHQLGEALVYAHAAGIVHRDLKPSNVMLVGGRTEDVRLVDFGVAKTLSRDLTYTGQMIGTPGYMAPEQALGRGTIDGRADLFALGATLYETLANTNPFPGEEVMHVLAKLLLHEPTPIEQVRAETPPRLAHLIDALLAKEPEARLADAGTIVAETTEMQRALAAGDTAALAERPVLVAGASAASRDAPTIAATPAARRRRWWIPAIAATVVLGAGALVFAMRTSKPAPKGVCTAELRTGCQERCTDGDGDACYYYGEALVLGLGVPRDSEQGVALLMRGCELASGKSCTKAGTRILELVDQGTQLPGITLTEAERILTRGCEQNTPTSCRRLGVEHLAPDGHFAHDDHAAYRYLTGACVANDQPACWKLYDLQQRGSGTPEERASAGAAIDAACAA